MINYNFHTHSVYCDGIDTPEDIIKEAINKGFSDIGFSSHSHTPFDPYYCMSVESTRIYRNKILELKEKYKSYIKVHLGIEQDILSPIKPRGYDFIIASLHYIKTGDEYISLDESTKTYERAVKVSGSAKEVARNYFSLVGNTLEYTSADIIGHFDIVTKFNENGVYFDENDSDYIKYAVNAMEKLISVPFEVNTGAMSRGYKTRPYPSLTLLKKLHDMGGRVVFSSDAHRKENIGYAYKEALELIRAAGFKNFLGAEEIIKQ